MDIKAFRDPKNFNRFLLKIEINCLHDSYVGPVRTITVQTLIDSTDILEAANVIYDEVLKTEPLFK